MISYLTSNFENGFTESFGDALRRDVKEGKLTFIASDFDAHELTDDYAEQTYEEFIRRQILVTELGVIDSRLEREDMLASIMESTVLWIAGGDTLKQIKAIKDYGLIDAIKKFEGVVIGMSAGAINMASEVVLAKDETDNIPELSLYDGIGRVQVNVEPHINTLTEKHEIEVKEAAKNGQIIGLYDESFIRIKDEQIQFIGPYLVY